MLAWRDVPCGPADDFWTVADGLGCVAGWIAADSGRLSSARSILSLGAHGMRGCISSWLAAGWLVAVVGCHGVGNGVESAPFGMAGPQPGPSLGSNQTLTNPLQVPVSDSEFFWNQLVDTVDDYFTIRSEQRAELTGGVPSEGLIETQYQPGATVLEPWRWDSISDFELAQSTLQSIRRRAVVRVIPVGNGTYGINVEVFKELEDVDRPAQSLAGSLLPRHDVSLLRFNEDRLNRAAKTIGWIPIGRDVALEQEILRQLYGRLVDSGA